MASARKDFEGFVRWLHLPENEVPSIVRRLANLVLDNFDLILATSRHYSQRSVCLASLAQQYLLESPEVLPDLDPVLPEGAWHWRNLHHITIGPFRGFRNPESFDLQKRINLFYGPNGSGKTSLCEAFEYALLGYVEEADVKRISADTYLLNIHEGRFLPPDLVASDHQGNEIHVDPNTDKYRFCFIDKNRINAFSRIAARSTAQRAELIATLFGTDNFNEFVGNFNESIDGQLNLTSTKRKILDSRREILVQDQNYVNSEVEVLLGYGVEEQTLVNDYAEDMTYDGLKNLIGSTEAPARLQQLNEILNAIPQEILNVTRQGLHQLYNSADLAQKELETINIILDNRTNEISFKDLFTSVIALQSTEGDHCPACDTPLVGLNHVLIDPYEKAAAGLLQLSELADLQTKQIQSKDVVAQISRDLKAELETLHKYVITKEEQDTKVGLYLSSLPIDVTGFWWTSIYEANDNADSEIPNPENILDIAQRIEDQDKATKLALEERQRNITERDRLNEYQLLIQAQDNKRQHFINEVAAARLRIESFDDENSELIQEVSQETSDNERDTPIKNAYDQFLQLLRIYCTDLPGTLIAGLNDLTMMLYNEFNRNDLDTDKLTALYLPLTSEQKIEISFRGNPQDRVDALNVLSEGHIRCLGLSVLLAKNLSFETPLIIFDDAINAIDHDHRRGIRETIFESDHFKNTQFIFTCHSNEFIKDIQQSLTLTDRNDSQVYLIGNHDGNYHPRVSGNLPSRNYIDVARAAREELNDRGALDASRKAIEILSERIWRWLGSHEHGNISVQLAGVGEKPGLRNLCEGLRKKINTTPNFVHVNKPLILSSLDRVLGIPEENLVWLYLNKGTHEEIDRDDFDPIEVEAIVVTLEELEALDLRSGR